MTHSSLTCSLGSRIHTTTVTLCIWSSQWRALFCFNVLQSNLSRCVLVAWFLSYWSVLLPYCLILLSFCSALFGALCPGVVFHWVLSYSAPVSSVLACFVYLISFNLTLLWWHCIASFCSAFSYALPCGIVLHHFRLHVTRTVEVAVFHFSAFSTPSYIVRGIMQCLGRISRGQAGKHVRKDSHLSFGPPP